MNKEKFEPRGSLEPKYNVAAANILFNEALERGSLSGDKAEAIEEAMEIAEMCVGEKK